MTRRIVHDGLHRDGLHHDAHHHDGLHREVLQHHEYEGHRHDGPSHEERQQGQRPEHSDDGLLDNEVGDVGNARTFCNTIIYLKGTVSQDFCSPPPPPTPKALFAMVRVVLNHYLWKLLKG